MKLKATNTLPKLVTIVLILLAVVQVVCKSVPAASTKVHTETKKHTLDEPVVSDSQLAEHYTWITFLSEGDPIWFNQPQDSISGYAFRVSITTAEIYKSITIDKVTYGEEGGDKRVAFIKRLDLEAELGVYGEITASLEFRKWLSPSSFQFIINEKVYQVDLKPDGSYKISAQ